MKNSLIIFTYLLLSISVFGQQNKKDSIPFYKFSVSTTLGTLTNFESEEKNLHHYEFHFGYKLSTKDRIGIKVATWKLYEPMGIPLWDSQFQKESEFFPGRLRESGIGITYQRLLWKGLFAQIEILPLWKQYLNENKKKIDDGFKLYTTYHLGYHIQLLKNRLFLEPQIHCNYWPINSKAPQAFQAMEDKWNNYFLLEPNLYIGFKF